VLFIGISLTMLWFVIRYHRSRAPEPTSQADSNIWLEIVWSALPTILVMVMFYYGWAGYLSLRNMPKDALQVTATARTWVWSFSYANGKTSPKLYVQAGKPVLVNLVSRDVLHGFYLPAFRIKRDVVPGMKNHVWFVADKPGSYDLFCSVYCGTGHSAMITTVEALPEAQFAAWLQGKGEGAEHEAGEHGADLAKAKGCLACHSLDGSRGVGPTFKGLYRHSFTVLVGAKRQTIVADDAYLIESIRLPNAKIVEGFQPIMPAMSDLTDAEAEELVEFIKGVK
jgi:cytochrome c oxidase subunit 2